MHSDKNHPRYRPTFQDRSSWLIRQGWAIAYVWLYKEHSHTNKVIEALLDYHRELVTGNPDRYRLYHWDGKLMERGGLEIEYYLNIDTAPWRKQAETDDDFDRRRYEYTEPAEIPEELKKPPAPRRLDVDLRNPPRVKDTRPIRPLRPYDEDEISDDAPLRVGRESSNDYVPPENPKPEPPREPPSIRNQDKA